MLVNRPLPVVIEYYNFTADRCQEVLMNNHHFGKRDYCSFSFCNIPTKIICPWQIAMASEIFEMLWRKTIYASKQHPSSKIKYFHFFRKRLVLYFEVTLIRIHTFIVIAQTSYNQICCFSIWQKHCLNNERMDCWMLFEHPNNIHISNYCRFSKSNNLT